MKGHQERWLADIRDRNTDDQLLTTCIEIASDDTGGTDVLLQQLAREIVALIIKINEAPTNVHKPKDSN